MLSHAITATKVVVAVLGVAGFVGRVVTAVRERRDTEKQRRADRARVIAQQDRNAEERRQERIIAQERRDAAEAQDS